jgi:hypothetical protein
MRPLVEFNKYESLDLLENLQNTARDTKHESKSIIDSLIRRRGARSTFLRNIFVRWFLGYLAIKITRGFFDTVAKVEKSILKTSLLPGSPYSYRRGAPMLGPYRGRARGRSSGPPATCYYCHQPGHRVARCFLRMSQSASSTSTSSKLQEPK